MFDEIVLQKIHIVKSCQSINCGLLSIVNSSISKVYSPFFLWFFILQVMVLWHLHKWSFCCFVFLGVQLYKRNIIWLALLYLNCVVLAC